MLYYPTAYNVIPQRLVKLTIDVSPLINGEQLYRSEDQERGQAPHEIGEAQFGRIQHRL